MRRSKGDRRAPQRILMVLENNPFPQDTRVRNEALALRDAGYQVDVIAPRGSGQRLVDKFAGIRVWRFQLARSHSTSPVSYLGEYLAAVAQIYLLVVIIGITRRVRFLHVHNPPDTFFPLGLLVRIMGGSFVFDHHDLAPELFVEKFGGGNLLLQALRWCQAMSFRAASLAIVTNESQREIALDRGGTEERLVVVRNGPPRSSAPPNDANEEALGAPKLVFVGGLEIQDGVSDLPTVLEELDQVGLEARLTIVGDGSLRKELERDFAKSAARERVKFTGWVSPSDVAALIAEADICIDPAPCSDLNHASTMIKVAEYLVAGKPVVAYDLVETSRTLGGAGFTVTCGDVKAFAARIVELAGSGGMRASASQRAKKRAESLVWEEQAPILIQAYRDL